MFRIVGYNSGTNGYLVLDTSDCSVEEVTEADMDDLLADGIGTGEHELRDRDSGLWASPEQGMFGEVLRVTDDLYLIPFANTMENQMYVHILSKKTGAFALVNVSRVLDADGQRLPTSLLKIEEVLTTKAPLSSDKPNKRLVMVRVSSDADSHLVVYDEAPKPRSKFLDIELYPSNKDKTYKGYLLFMFDESMGTAKLIQTSVDGFRSRPMVLDSKLVYEDKEVADLADYL